MAQQIHTQAAGETLVLGVNYTPRLLDGDQLTGTPTAVASPSGPTLSNIQFNSATVTILRESVTANRAVLVTVAGGTAGITYVITVTAQTVSGQTLIERCMVKFEA